MTWVTGLFALFDALVEGLKAAFIWDAAKTKERLKQMEAENDEITRATTARNADGLPDDLDPYNRSK